MITDTASIETNLPGGTVPVALVPPPSRQKRPSTSLDFQDHKANLAVPLVEEPFPTLPAFLPTTKNRPSPGFQPLIVAVPSHRRPATEVKYTPAKRVEYVSPSTASKYKRNTPTATSVEVVPNPSVSTLETLIKSNLTLSHVVSQQKSKNANTPRLSSTSIDHFLRSYKQQRKSGPAAMIIQRWWRMLTLRRRFLKYYAFYKKQRTKFLMPYFFALQQLTAAASHYRFTIARKIFLGWREVVLDKEPKELYKVPEQIDKLSLQLTTFVAFKEASKGTGVDKLVTAFRFMSLERTFKRAFYFWLRFVRERKRRMRQLAELIHTTASAITHTKMKLVFTMWRRYTRVKKCEKLHRPLPEFQKPYESWDLWYAVYKRKAGLVKLAQSRWREKKLSKAFEAWKLYVDIQREKRQKLQRAEQHLMIRRAGVCFKAWKEHTKQMRMVKQIGVMTLKAWRTWTKLRTRLKSNFVLIHIRRTMFKQQGCFQAWKKFYEYRVATICAGVVAIRNDPARALWGIFAWQQNKPQFLFLSAWLQWSRKAKRRLCLKRFLLAKQQLRNRKLMQLCFTALKMHHKSPVELDINEAQPTPEELVELLEKIKIGALRPENTCVEQLYAESFPDGNEEFPKTKRTHSMPEIKRKNKRSTNQHASQPDPEKLLQRKLRHEKLMKMTPAKQKLFFLNEAVDKWMIPSDAPLWVFITALLLEQKAKKTADLKQMFRGLDPTVKKLAKAKETLGKMGITNPMILKAFYNDVKLDMMEAHEVMEWKVVRDNYLLLADTALDAAKALNELRPAFTLEQDRKRFKRDPFPAYEFPNKFKALAPPNFKVKQVFQHHGPRGSVSESSDSDVDRTSSPKMSVESILPRRSMVTDIYNPLPPFSTDKTLFDLIRDLVNAHKQLEILEGANKAPKAKPPIGEEIAAATKAEEAGENGETASEATAPTMNTSLVFNPELESIYQSVVLNNPPLPSFDPATDLPWLTRTEEVSEFEQQKFLRFSVPSNNSSSLVSNGTRGLSSKPSDHMSDAKVKLEEIQKKKSEEAQKQREEFQTMKERRKQEEQDKLKQREKQIQRDRMLHEKAKRKAREKLEKERQKRKEDYERQLEMERLAKFSDENLLLDKTDDVRRSRGRSRSVSEHPVLFRTRDLEKLNAEYRAEEEEDDLMIKPKPRSAKRAETARAITPEMYNRLTNVASNKPESPLLMAKSLMAPRLNMKAHSVDGLVRPKRSGSAESSLTSSNTLAVPQRSPGRSPSPPVRDRKPYFPGLITEKTDTIELLTIKRLHVPPPRAPTSPRSPKSPSSPRSPRSSTENSDEDSTPRLIFPDDSFIATATPASKIEKLKEILSSEDEEEEEEHHHHQVQGLSQNNSSDGIRIDPKVMAAHVKFLIQSPSQLEIEMKQKPAKKPNPVSQWQGAPPAILEPPAAGQRPVSAPQPAAMSDFFPPQRPQLPEFRIMQSFFSKATKIEELPTAPPKEFQLQPSLPTPSKPSFAQLVEKTKEEQKPQKMAAVVFSAVDSMFAGKKDSGRSTLKPSASDPLSSSSPEYLQPSEESQDFPAVTSPTPSPYPSPRPVSPRPGSRPVSAATPPVQQESPSPSVSPPSPDTTDDESSSDDSPRSVESRVVHPGRPRSQGSVPTRPFSSLSQKETKSRYYSFYHPSGSDDEQVVKRYYEPVMTKRTRPHTAHTDMYPASENSQKGKEEDYLEEAYTTPTTYEPLPLIQASLPSKILRQKPVTENSANSSALPEVDPIAALLESELAHLRKQQRKNYAFSAPNIDLNMRPRRNTAPSVPLRLPSPRLPATAIISKIVIKDSHTIEYVPANSGGSVEQQISPPKPPSSPPKLRHGTPPVVLAATAPPVSLPPVVEIKFTSEASIPRLNE